MFLHSMFQSGWSFGRVECLVCLLGPSRNLAIFSHTGISGRGHTWLWDMRPIYASVPSILVLTFQLILSSKCK